VCIRDLSVLKKGVIWLVWEVGLCKYTVYSIAPIIQLFLKLLR
jgi:hypothetical protein